jgi:hypothetical protein
MAALLKIVYSRGGGELRACMTDAVSEVAFDVRCNL